MMRTCWSPATPSIQGCGSASPLRCLARGPRGHLIAAVERVGLYPWQRTLRTSIGHVSAGGAQVQMTRSEAPARFGSAAGAGAGAPAAAGRHLPTVPPVSPHLAEPL